MTEAHSPQSEPPPDELNEDQHSPSPQPVSLAEEMAATLSSQQTPGIGALIADQHYFPSMQPKSTVGTPHRASSSQTVPKLGEPTDAQRHHSQPDSRPEESNEDHSKAGLVKKDQEHPRADPSMRNTGHPTEYMLMAQKTTPLRQHHYSKSSQFCTRCLHTSTEERIKVAANHAAEDDNKSQRRPNVASFSQ